MPEQVCVEPSICNPIIVSNNNTMTFGAQWERIIVRQSFFIRLGKKIDRYSYFIRVTNNTGRVEYIVYIVETRSAVAFFHSHLNDIAFRANDL